MAATMKSRRVVLLAFGASTLLAGCAALHTPGNIEIASYGQWPAGRSGQSFAIERLAYQVTDADEQQAMLESAATAALVKAGFKPAPSTQTADIVVTIGLRMSVQGRHVFGAGGTPWEQPDWWRAGGSYDQWRYTAGTLPFGGQWTEKRFNREVVLMLRERGASLPLWSGHASSDGDVLGNADVFNALFIAALSDFPRSRPVTHRP